MNSGTLYYNQVEVLQPGPVDIKFQVASVRDLPNFSDLQASFADSYKLTLAIDFYRNGTYIASFTAWPVAFSMPSNVLDGSGDFA